MLQGLNAKCSIKYFSVLERSTKDNRNLINSKIQPSTLLTYADVTLAKTNQIGLRSLKGARRMGSKGQPIARPSRLERLLFVLRFTVGCDRKNQCLPGVSAVFGCQGPLVFGAVMPGTFAQAGEEFGFVL